MIKLPKIHINKMVEEKYTILIVPNGTKTTKHLVLNKMMILISLIFTIALTGLFIILIGLYSNERRDNTELNASNRLHKSNIEMLQRNMDEKQEEVNLYKEAAQSVKDKMDELLELEGKINNILDKEAVKLPASRGGSITTSSTNISADETIKRLNEILSRLKAYESTKRKIPSILPCSGDFTSEFGRRSNPFGRKSTETHEGIDISGYTGTPIKATADGLISYSGWKNGYGNVVIINHGNGYESFYGHNSKLKVTEGAQVKRGDVIALMGSTGRSTGPHCHFEIRLNGIPIDPLKLVK